MMTILMVQTMIVKVKNHERMVRLLAQQYDVQFCLTHGETMDCFYAKGKRTSKCVTVQVPSNYDFMHSLSLLYRTKYTQLNNIYGRDFTNMIGTIVSWVNSLQDYNEPLYFTTELMK